MRKVLAKIIKDTGATFPCDKFLGAHNLDTNAQTCTVLFYAGTDSSNVNALIGIAYKPAAGAIATNLASACYQGIDIMDRYLTYTSDTAPTGNGIIVYYELEIQ